MKIKAAVVYEQGKPFVLEELELDDPKAGEILVKVAACGVCHTDEGAQHQAIPVPLPIVLGHEGAGIVEKVGPGVTEFQVGDRVGFSFASCGECEECLEGRPYACRELNTINFGGIMLDGTTRLHKDGKDIATFFGQGTFATYAVVHSRQAVRVPYEDIDLGIIAPFGCGIQTGAGAVLNTLNPKFYSSIAVFGCGTVGMSAIMAAKIAGCRNIIAVGGNPKSLKLAMELGATHTVNRKECEDIAGRIKEITDGGCHYAIDTSGTSNFVKTALACLRFKGTAVVLGLTGDVTINIQQELMGEAKSLVGVVEGDANPKTFIPKLIEYYREGKFPVNRLMKFYDFEDINRAFEESHQGVAIKSVLKMQP